MVSSAEETCIECSNANKNLLLLTSQINKAIIRIKDESELFAEICRLTVEIGRNAVSWVGQPDKVNKNFNAIAQYNATDEDKFQLGSRKYDPNGPTATVIKTGKFYISNNFKQEVWDEPLRNYLWQRGFRSYLALPIRKYGIVEYTLNLYSANANFFSDEQIQFLEGISDDISYAIDNIENEIQKTVADNQLREMSSLLQRTESVTKTGSWKVNFESGISYWSDEAFKIYGMQPHGNKMSYIDWVTLIHPDDKKTVINIDNEASKTLSDTVKNYRIITQAGLVKFVQTHAYYELDENGKPIGMYGLVRDITAKNEMEEAFRQSEKNLRVMVDVIPQPIFLKDLSGNFIYANKSYCDLYGKSVAEMNQSNWLNMEVPNVDRDRIIKDDNDTINSGRTKKINDFPFKDHSGADRYFDVIKTPFQMPDKTMAILGVLNEITERKQQDIIKSELLNDLTIQNKNMQQCSYIISHNLRAPLANILGICNILTEAKTSTINTGQFINGLALSAEKLDNVIRDLSTIMQAKESNIQKDNIVFQQVVDDVKLSLMQVEGYSDTEIKCNFEELESISSIKSFVHSIFYNLISNSIKYCRPGVAPVLEITSRKTKNGYELIFTDNGQGIDLKKNQDKIFELYSRFDTSKDGTGVGLYIVKTQVEALNGQITVNSELDHGTTFIINIKQ